jgi:sec-independent protein translocase protein TatB
LTAGVKTESEPMFNVGGMELVVIGVLALVVFGPDRLPGALRQAGAVLGRLRQISQGFQTDLTSALARAEADVDTSTAEAATTDQPAT